MPTFPIAVIMKKMLLIIPINPKIQIDVMTKLNEFLTLAVEAGIWLFNFIGLLVIIGAGIKAITDLCRRREHIRLHLAKGMALGLEFKLGGEILRTVIVRSFSEIATVACIIALRASLSLLIHWEIKHGKEDL